jgi:hypothetical protein
MSRNTTEVLDDVIRVYKTEEYGILRLAYVYIELAQLLLSVGPQIVTFQP